MSTQRDDASQQEEPMHEATCYLIVQADKFHERIRGVRVVAVRARRPSLAADEAAIKVTLDVPDSLFDAEAVALVVDPREAMLAVEQEPIEA